MNRHALLIPVVLAVFGLPVLAAIQEGRSAGAAIAIPVSETTPGLWSLNAEYRGDGYNLDWNMTLEDCLRNVPRNQPDKALYFSCDRQP